MKIKNSANFDFRNYFVPQSGRLSSAFLAVLAFPLLVFMNENLQGTEPEIVIHWSSETVSGHPDILTDANGTALSAGGSGNGDGCLVTLGYFDQASAGNPFLGTWIPLTHGTRIGDSSSGYGFEDGMFSFTTVFTRLSDSVTVYPYRPASYSVTTPHTIEQNIPQANTPICIRFYDGTDTGLTARYNTVTGSGWVWPAFPSGQGIPSNLYLKVARGPTPSNSLWAYGDTFEDSDHNFSAAKTTEFDLAVSVSGGGSVTDVNGSYEYGTVVDLNASADDHMEFVGWLGDGVTDPTLPITTIAMNQDRNLTAVFQDKMYSVLVNPQGNGSVSGEGNYTFGTIVNLTATPSTGHSFSHWNGFGPDSNTSASTTLSVSQDHAIVGVFVAQSFDLNVTSQDPTAGQAEAETGPYFYDGNYTINATPNPGYAFTHWTSSTNSLVMLESNSSQTTNLILTGDASFEAQFSLTTYELEVLMGTGGQSVSPSTGQQSSIALVPVTAQAIDGYEFTNWDDPSGVLVNPNLASTDANMSRATGDVTITARFSIRTHEIVIIEDPGGNAGVTPSLGPWEHFGVYDINATPLPGYVFDGWSGTTSSTDCLLDSNLSNPNNQIWLKNAVTLTANFSQKTYVIEVSDTEGGTVTGDGNYTINDSPILEANESIGWDFSGWTGDHLEYLSDPNASLVTVSLSQAPTFLQYDAIFVRETYDLNVTIEGSGSVSFNGSDILNQTIDSNTTVQLLATPPAGWQFNQWYGSPVSGNSTASVSFIPTESSEIRAKFNRNQYTVTVNQNANGDANGSGIYEFEDEVTISATPASGYAFHEWTGDVLSLADPSLSETTVTIPAGNVSVTPNFQPIPFQVLATNSGNGSISGAGEYTPGSAVTLEGIGDNADGSAPRGYRLDKWTWTKGDGTSGQSTDNPLSFTADDNYTLIAYFSAIPPNEVDFSLVSNPVGSGVLFDDPDKRIWDIESDLYQRTISASPQTGFSFIGWSSSPSLTYAPSWKASTIETLPSQDSVLTANFSPLLHKVEIEHNASRGSVSGEGSNFDSNQKTTISAQPLPNYDFSGWTINKTLSYSVTRQSSSINLSSNKLFIDNHESPALSLIRGFTYEFDCNLEETDLFYISSDANATEVYGGEYLQGISNSRSSNGTLSFTVPENAPDQLYYLSSGSPDEVNSLNIVSLSDADILPYPENLSIQPLLNFDLKLTANFIPQEFLLTFSANQGGHIASPTSGNYPFGQVLSLVAVPENHYEFVRWEGSDLIANPQLSNTTIEVDQESLILAVFQDVQYQVNLSVSPTGTGIATIVEGNDGHLFGDEVNLIATPTEDYVFESWTGGTVQDPASSQTKATVTGNLNLQANFKEKLYSIALSVETMNFLGERIDPSSSGGTVLAPSLVKPNQANAFSAIPAEGYSFLRWEDAEGSTLSTSMNASLSFSESTSVNALFKQNSYEVEFEITPAGSGYLSLDQQEIQGNATITMGHGISFDLNAFPIGDFAFEKWTSNSDLDTQSTSSLLAIEPEDGLRIVAHFKAISPPYLQVYGSPQNGGIVFGGGYRQNALHPIFAAPYEGFQFSHWVGSGIGNSNDYETYVIFDTNTSITAVFQKESTEPDPQNPVIDQNGTSTLSLLSSNSEHGGVNGSGTFGYGWTNISAIAKNGFHFVRWEGDYVTDPLSENTQVYLTQDTVALTAVFEETTSEVNYATVTQKVTTRDHNGNSISTLIGGNIIGGTSFSFGSSPTFHALANTGFKFIGWVNAQGEILESASKYSFPIDQDVTVEAIFEELAFEVSIHCSPEAKGSVRWDGKGESYTFSHTIPYGEQINLYALPNQGYGFVRWVSTNFQSPTPENPVLTITGLDQNIELNATFSQNPPLYLNIEISPQSAGWAIGHGAYDYDSSHLIFAKTNPGYLFSRWSGEGIQNQLNANTSINLDQNKTVTAYFVEDPNSEIVDSNNSGLFNLLVISSNAEQGIAAGSGVYGPGWIGVFAQASEGYLFDGWTGGEFSDSTDSNTQYRLSNDSIITANFKTKPIITDSMDLGSGWFSSEWFGTYWMYPNQNWVFHSTHGWIYLHINDNEDTWVWSDRLSAWMWTAMSTNQWYYLHSQSAWIYFDHSANLYFSFEDYPNSMNGSWYQY